jgi:hypothetical protein
MALTSWLIYTVCIILGEIRFNNVSELPLFKMCEASLFGTHYVQYPKRGRVSALSLML